MKFKGTIIITDPCYIVKDGDWSESHYGDNMNAIGTFSSFLVKPTVYGDWSCTTFEKDTKKPLGRFCADAGLVGVFLLDEVLEYNPEFDYHEKRDWTTTLIKDFDGDIKIQYNEDIKEIEVIGTGNINFFTRQTGF